MNELIKYVNNMLGTKGLMKREKELWEPPTEIDLFRMCAVQDKGFMSRYVFANGVWDYSGPAVVSPLALTSLYMNKAAANLSKRDIAQEHCPLCGVYGWTVYCCECSRFICRGRTTATDYFRCRRSCGKEGQLVKGSHAHTGMAL